MKIGVVSDTHNNLKNVRRIVEIFNEHRVDRVIHTGDITKGSTLELFEDLEAPLFGVFGNNDVEREGLDKVIEKNGFVFARQLTLEWESRTVFVVHEPNDLTAMQGQFDVALHGHTHLYRAERTPSQQLIFNPGESAGHMPGRNAVGILNLPQLTTSLVNF